MNKELQKLKEEFEQRIKELENKYNTEEEREIKYGDDYWIISSYGLVDKHTWIDDCFDNIALGNNAIFRTIEEASFEAERLKVLRELEKMGKPYDDRLLNWCICLDGNSIIDYYCEIEERVIYGNYYFRSEKEAKEAVEKIGEDRIKKYLFGVENSYARRSYQAYRGI